VQESKVRNVLDHLPKELKPQMVTAMRAAFRLKHEDDIAKLEQ
jgi:hypothetical protein